jgi:tRNA (cmo5U34)-methyltransferase
MLTQARRIAEHTPDAHIPIDWIAADARHYTYAPCSVVTVNFTLQFIPVEERLALLARLADAMVPGGCLILAEKTCVADPDSQQVITDIHHDFKRANGYSELEIAQKRTSIENFLIPETEEAHIARLQAAGFQTVIGFFHCLNFRAWMAQR